MSLRLLSSMTGRSGSPSPCCWLCNYQVFIDEVLGVSQPRWGLSGSPGTRTHGGQLLPHTSGGWRNLIPSLVNELQGLADGIDLPVLLHWHVPTIHHVIQLPQHALSVAQLEICDQSLVARLKDERCVGWQEKHLDIIAPVIHVGQVSRHIVQHHQALVQVLAACVPVDKGKLKIVQTTTTMIMHSVSYKNSLG